MAAKNSSGALAKNFVVIIFIYATIIWIVLRWVSNYTQFGVTVKVPNLIGKMPAEIKKMDNLDLEFVINDSTYNAEKKKGSAVEQNPEPGAQVKQGRKVYVTINAFKPPLAKMPKLIDMSLRQATSILETFGLKVGNLKYEPDFAKDAVLKQLYKGSEITPGTSIIQESKIDLVLGDGLKAEQIPMPDLINLTAIEAQELIQKNKLNIGSTMYDKSVKDTLKAKVYRQFPTFRNETKVNVGRAIDIFLTQDADKIKSIRDSINNAKENADHEE